MFLLLHYYCSLIIIVQKWPYIQGCTLCYLFIYFYVIYFPLRFLLSYTRTLLFMSFINILIFYFFTSPWLLFSFIIITGQKTWSHIHDFTLCYYIFIFYVCYVSLLLLFIVIFYNTCYCYVCYIILHILLF